MPDSHLESLYQQAQAAIKARDYEYACELLKRILVVDEAYKDTSRLLARAVRLRKRRWYNDPRLWGVLGAVAVFILGFVIAPKIGGYFASPAAPTNTVTPTEINTTMPTTTPTVTPTRTSRPTITYTPISAWVSSFVEPMLDRITNVTPDFMEDFSNPQRGWEMVSGPDGSFRIEDSVARVNVEKEERSHFNHPTVQSLTVRDFIMEMDARIVEGKVTEDLWIHFIFNENPSDSQFVGFRAQPVESTWSITIDSSQGRNFLEGKENINPIGQFTHIKIILADQKIAFLLNGNPIAYFEDPFLDESATDFHFICDGFSTGGVCEFDNIKIWKLP